MHWFLQLSVKFTIRNPCVWKNNGTGWGTDRIGKQIGARVLPTKKCWRFSIPYLSLSLFRSIYLQTYCHNPAGAAGGDYSASLLVDPYANSTWWQGFLYVHLHSINAFFMMNMHEIYYHRRRLTGILIASIFAKLKEIDELYIPQERGLIIR